MPHDMAFRQPFCAPHLPPNIYVFCISQQAGSITQLCCCFLIGNSPFVLRTKLTPADSMVCGVWYLPAPLGNMAALLLMASLSLRHATSPA